MRKPLLILGLAAAVLHGQNLYDLVIGSSPAQFMSSGPAVPTYTYESRMIAAAGVTLIDTGLLGGLACGTDASYNFRCISGGEQTPLGGPGFQLTGGADYRFRFQHDAASQTVTLTVWSGNCTQLYSTQYPIPTPLSLPMSGTRWTLGPAYQVSFSRLYSGTNTSGACPVDAPAARANLWDFTFEAGDGSAGSLFDRGGNGYAMTAPGSSFVTSAAYNPVAVVSGITTPKPVFAVASAFTMSGANSISFLYPGTGAVASYSWSQISGPTDGLCILAFDSTATPLLNCNTAGQYAFQLSVADSAGNTSNVTQLLGLVVTNTVGVVQIGDPDFANALSNGNNLLMHGASAWPWYEATEAADIDLMATPVTAPINEVEGAGTVTIPSTGINILAGGNITGSAYGSVAIQGTGTDFASADVGTPIEITWDPDGDGTDQGHFVTEVWAVDVANQVITTQFNNILEPAAAFASGLSWHRLAQGSGTCTGLTATVSGGQVTGIAGAGGCSGFYWWAYFPPTVTFTGGGGTGCNVTAALIAYPAAGAGGISGFNGLPCGSGYTSAPSVTVTAYSDWKPYNMQDQLSQIFNFYEAGLAIGRFWQRTQLTAYQAEFHGFCTNTWRWSLDSGYTSAVPRNLGLDLILACATDPSWTPPSGMSAEIAGVARITMNSAGSAYTSFTGGTTPVYNPTTDILPALIDPRETSYLTRWSAKLAQLTTGSTQTAWCGYLANQITHMWLVDAAIPSGDTTGSKFFPENLFFNNQSFPAAGVPPVTGPFGTSPWRDGGLPAIALSDSYTALSGPCANATVAAQLHNAAGTGLVDGVANFAWNYSRAPDGGTFYAGAYASNTQGGFPAIWNTFVNGLQTGSVTAAGTAVTGVGTYFTRVFCPAGACNLGMQINGTNYTVAAVASDTSLTLTSSAGTVASTGNFGSTCVLNVTNGSTAVTGTGCKFSAMFGAFSPWIYGAGVYAGIISPNDKNVYGVTVNSDSSATLNTAFVDAGCASGCSLGSFTVVPISPNGVQFCGGDSLFTYCNPDPFSGRNLSQDLCYIYAWMYQQTSNVIWRSHTDQCYNKIYGGAAGGSGAFGAPTGASLYNRPGVITVSQGSPMVAGAGTQFTQQFTRGSQITIGDGTASGNTWASPPGANPTFYTLTVATVDSDRSLTLTGNYPGTGASATGMFYNPSDPQWSGADGGAGNLGEILPFCGSTPCGANMFPSMYGKVVGMGPGAGNVPLALGMIANVPPFCRPPVFRIGVCQPPAGSVK